MKACQGYSRGKEGRKRTSRRRSSKGGKGGKGGEGGEGGEGCEGCEGGEGEAGEGGEAVKAKARGKQQASLLKYFTYKRIKCGALHIEQAGAVQLKCVLAHFSLFLPPGAVGVTCEQKP